LDAIVSAIFSATGLPRGSAKIGEVVNFNPGRARFGAKQEGSIKCCSRGEFARTFAAYGHCLLPRSLRKRRSTMKRAVSAIASMGILLVTVGVETANAQSYRRYGPAQTYSSQAYPPQSRGSVGREGVLRTVPFSDPNSPEATGGGSLGYNRTVPRW
jgi:hypothetical protein